MSPNPNSFDSASNSNASQREGNAAPSATDVFRANQAANQRHVGPATDAPVILGYKPSGRIGALGLPLLLLALVLVPVVCAFLYEHLWHFGGLLVFSAMGLGLLAGLVMFGVIHVGKVRNTTLATIVGALVGLATFGLSMELEALSYRPQFVQLLASSAAQSKGLKPQQAQDLAERFLTPTKTAQIYWTTQAEQGVTLTSTHSRTGSVVSGPMFWALEGLELLLVTLFCIILAVAVANRRYSEEFDRWYTSKNVYSVHPQHVTALIDAANTSDWNRCQQIAQGSKTENQVGAQVGFAFLPQKPGGIMTIKAVTDTKKSLQPVFERELDNSEMKTMWPAFPMPNTTAQPFSS